MILSRYIWYNFLLASHHDLLLLIYFLLVYWNRANSNYFGVFRYGVFCEVQYLSSNFPLLMIAYKQYTYTVFDRYNNSEFLLAQIQRFISLSNSYESSEHKNQMRKFNIALTVKYLFQLHYFPTIFIFLTITTTAAKGFQSNKITIIEFLIWERDENVLNLTCKGNWLPFRQVINGHWEKELSYTFEVQERIQTNFLEQINSSSVVKDVTKVCFYDNQAEFHIFSLINFTKVCHL